MQKLLPPTLFLICLIISALFHIGLPMFVLFDNLYHWLGIPLIAIGMYLAVSGSILFSTKKTNINTFKDPDKLVTTGLFRISRNPMYLGFLLALIGAWWLMGSLTAGIGSALFFFAAHYWYIPFEEKRCREVFGEDYINYQRSVRRWL